MKLTLSHLLAWHQKKNPFCPHLNPWGKNHILKLQHEKWAFVGFSIKYWSMFFKLHFISLSVHLKINCLDTKDRTQFLHTFNGATFFWPVFPIFPSSFILSLRKPFVGWTNILKVLAFTLKLSYLTRYSLPFTVHESIFIKSNEPNPLSPPDAFYWPSKKPLTYREVQKALAGSNFYCRAASNKMACYVPMETTTFDMLEHETEDWMSKMGGWMIIPSDVYTGQ